MDAAISEDSDLIAYGCSRVLYKMDPSGNGEEILHENIVKTTHPQFRFHDFTPEMIQDMCIMSGCDYVASLPGFGLVRAHESIRQSKTIKKLIHRLRYQGKISIPSDYEKRVERAKLTFRHQRVYDPELKVLDLDVSIDLRRKSCT